MLAERAIEGGLAEYKRWGFLACERPTIDARSRKTIGSWDKAARINILRRLVEGRSEIRISEYLDALGRSVSRQQALVDLKGMKDLAPQGRGRGATWRRVQN